MSRRRQIGKNSRVRQDRRKPRSDVVDAIRSRSKYPVYRSLTKIVLYICYAGGAIYAALGLWLWMQKGEPAAGIAALIAGAIGALVVILGRYLFEASSMLADCADSLIVLCEKSKNRSKQEPPTLEPWD